MAAIAVQDAAGGGVLDVTFSAATAGGDTVVVGSRAGGYNLGTVYLLYKNAHSADQTVTVDGTAYVVPFGAGKVAMLPAFRGVYGGSVNITYSGATALTVGAVRL
jgi:hypothetical protein